MSTDEYDILFKGTYMCAKLWPVCIHVLYVFSIARGNYIISGIACFIYRTPVVVMYISNALCTCYWYLPVRV